MVARNNRSNPQLEKFKDFDIFQGFIDKSLKVIKLRNRTLPGSEYATLAIKLQIKASLKPVESAKLAQDIAVEVVTSIEGIKKPDNYY